MSTPIPPSTELIVSGLMPAPAASRLKRASQAAKLSVLRQPSFGGG